MQIIQKITGNQVEQNILRQIQCEFFHVALTQMCCFKDKFYKQNSEQYSK